MIIEDALTAYFEKLKKAEYTHSFRKAAKDEEIALMVEEGLDFPPPTKQYTAPVSVW